MFGTLISIQFSILRAVACAALSLSFPYSTSYALAEGLISFEGTSLKEKIQNAAPNLDQKSVSSSTVPITGKQSKSTNLNLNVKNAQSELNRLGCNAGYPDGVIGVKTKNALKKLNKFLGKQFVIEDISQKSFIQNIMQLPDGLCKNERKPKTLYAGEWNVKTLCLLVPGRGTLKLESTAKKHIYSAFFSDNWGVEARGTFTLKGNDFDLKLKRKILRYSFTGSGSFINSDYGEGWTSEACSFSMVRKADG